MGAIQCHSSQQAVQNHSQQAVQYHSPQLTFNTVCPSRQINNQYFAKIDNKYRKLNSFSKHDTITRGLSQMNQVIRLLISFNLNTFCRLVIKYYLLLLAVVGDHQLNNLKHSQCVFIRPKDTWLHPVSLYLIKHF